jgi:branched-chain amino acid transport system substrate-binding protein
MDRRHFIKSSGATLAGTSSLVLPWSALAADEIGIGSIHDLSGGLDIYGKPMLDALTLAIEEQNAAGGLLGKKLKLFSYDPQSNMQMYAQFAQQAALKDKVAVVHGGITSASREVIRPVLNKNKTLYFYNTQYEGGVCDRGTFCTGVTPAQTVAKLVPYAMNKWGKKVYVIAADYNYGQITSQWVKKFTLENGGSVASIDFFPLDVTNFGPTISKIEAAKPDMVVSALVGGAHMSFYRQWAAAGLTKKIPLASTTFAGGNEHIVLSAAEADGFLISYNYFQNLDTPANKAFKERFYARFGKDYPNITELAMGTYQGFKLWAEGVKKAGSVDLAKVTTALESGISYDGPSGKVSIDPATHHCVLNVSIAEVKNKQLNILQTFQQQAPTDTSAVCNLQKNPKDNQQYVIKA